MHLMKWPSLFRNRFEEHEKPAIRQMIISDNLRRGRVLAIAVIIFEAIFILINLGALLLQADESFQFGLYLLMYGLMIAVNVLFLVLAGQRRRPDDIPPEKIRFFDNLLLLYMTFSMVWGSVVTLLDQQLYGQVTVFMVNMIINSVIFVIEARRMLIPYLISAVILLAGLPFLQPNPDVLIGHYANLAVFMIIAWLASRLLYHSYCRNLTSKLALNQANFKLKQLSLVDELTGIANRRGLRNFITQVFEQREYKFEKLSVMMVDIDNFKQYNDCFGHAAADRILAALAELLDAAAASPLEIAARMGGDEFILISFSLSLPQLEEISGKIRDQVVELAGSSDNSPGQVTVSIGASQMPVCVEQDVAKVIEAADSAMYQAKSAGRNRVCLQTADGSPAAARARLDPVTSPEQAGIVARLARKIWTEHYTPIIGADQVEHMLNCFQTREKIWQEIADNACRYELLRMQGEPAGYMAYRYESENRAVFLSKLYIDRPFRGNRLARLMLDRLIEFGGLAGASEIYLTVNKNNTGSIAAYERMGFVQTDSVVKDIGGGFIMDDYVMRLGL